MCYNIAYLEKKLSKLQERYKEVIPGVPQYKPGEELPLYYFVSGFSHPGLPVIKHDGIALYEWGLIPHWAKDNTFASKIRTQTLNARAETVFEKPSFRNAVKNNRCLLPINGFFEWREVNKVKYPYFIKLKSEEIFSLGCIYDSWTDKETGELKHTFSIITTPANPKIAKIHNKKKRMPYIVPRSDEKTWISPELSPEQAKKMIIPYIESDIEAYTVSRELNNPRNNRNIPEALEKADYSI